MILKIGERLVDEESRYAHSRMLKYPSREHRISRFIHPDKMVSFDMGSSLDCRCICPDLTNPALVVAFTHGVNNRGPLLVWSNHED